MSSLTIIAGPCSIDNENIKEILELDKVKINKKKVIAGTRIVGLKSRTSLSNDLGMGIDFPTYKKNLHIYMNGGSHRSFELPPSLKYINEVLNKTELVVATEIMNPVIQLPMLEGIKDRMLIWNPSVNQLGWQIMETALFASKNNWKIGIKNGKWTGRKTPSNKRHEAIENTWGGLVSYAKSITEEVIIIHRGFCTHKQSDYRNEPIHSIAAHTKLQTKTKLFYDPSHALGPNLKHKIVEDTIRAMNERIGSDFLYDGILIEVGNSKTDTLQHITLSELNTLVKELSKFRTLVTPSEFAKGVV